MLLSHFFVCFYAPKILFFGHFKKVGPSLQMFCRIFIGFLCFSIEKPMFYASTRRLWRCVKKVVGRHVFVTFRLSGWKQVWRQVGLRLGAGLGAGRGQVWRQVGSRIGSKFEVNRAPDFPFTKPRTFNPKVSRPPTPEPLTRRFPVRSPPAAPPRKFRIS